MRDHRDRDAVRVQLTSALTEAGGLALAVLFGSVARGRERTDSDLDIALLPLDPDAFDATDEHRVRRAVAEVTGTRPTEAHDTARPPRPPRATPSEHARRVSTV